MNMEILRPNEKKIPLEVNMRLRIFLLFTLFLLPLTVSADGILTLPDVYPYPFSISNVEVDVTIDENIAVTRITQTYLYTSDTVSSPGQYLLPIPDGPAPANVQIYEDNNPITFTAYSAEEARSYYLSTAQITGNPALLENAENGSYISDINPLLPQTTRTITIEYSQQVECKNGLCEYTLPLRLGKLCGFYVDDLSINVNLSSTSLPLVNIYSPSHSLSISRTSAHNATANFQEEGSILNQDFLLFFSLTDDSFGFKVLPYKKNVPDGYFSALLAPQYAENISENSKDVIFVIDNSGSMQGDKISQAKAALSYCLGNLNPTDRFSLIIFNSAIISYSSVLMAATAESIQQAQNFVPGIIAGGGYQYK